jgi:hypothetical protein
MKRRARGEHMEFRRLRRSQRWRTRPTAWRAAVGDRPGVIQQRRTAASEQEFGCGTVQQSVSVCPPILGSTHPPPPLPLQDRSATISPRRLPQTAPPRRLPQSPPPRRLPQMPPPRRAEVAGADGLESFLEEQEPRTASHRWVLAQCCAANVVILFHVVLRFFRSFGYSRHPVIPPNATRRD